MSWIEKHIDEITQAAQNWLRSDNQSLKKAIDKTVEENLFSFEDIKHQILVLKENVEAGQIKEWTKRSGLSEEKNAKGKKVLCLHAGNLPLVGFQTTLGTILSGADYYGKLSRKDPYMLASFLEEVKNSGLDLHAEYSTDLNQFKNLKADKVAFAGSTESVQKVREEIKRLKAAKADADYIIRTAKFSIAYIEDQSSETMEDLVEAAFRYGGKGCRSVALVVTKFPLDSTKCGFTDYIEFFWMKNPQHKKPKPNLKYQFAYNKAIGRSQAWLDDFLIQETDEFPETDFTLNWVMGDEKKVRELKEKFGDVIQAVYTTKKIEGIKTDLLSQAQRPPLWWKPDGVDTIISMLD
ncbi:MAG: acyl-CoA reductase [Balneolaceae bacterium]